MSGPGLIKRPQRQYRALRLITLLTLCLVGSGVVSAQPDETPWSPLIDACMAEGGSRGQCIDSLPPEILADLEAWEARNGSMRRRQMAVRSMLDPNETRFGQARVEDNQVLLRPEPAAATGSREQDSPTRIAAMIERSVPWWPAIVFGWPAITVALLLAALGIRRGRPVLLAIAVVISMPFSLYLAGSPRTGLIGVSIPLFLIAAAVCVRFRRPEFAWMLLVPVIVCLGWLGSVVLGQ